MPLSDSMRSAVASASPTAGTAAANGLVVLGASKDIATITTATITNLDAGASGSAGTVDIFPTTASKGKLALTAADSAGNTTTTLVNASQATTRTYTIPDALASCNFLMGTQAAVAVTATADGLTTGIIADGGVYQHITVTSANSAHLVTLPTPTPGTIVVIDCITNGCKIRSSAPASVAINGGTGASASSTLAAGETAMLFCTTATAWKGFKMDADSDVAKVPAAA